MRVCADDRPLHRQVDKVLDDLIDIHRGRVDMYRVLGGPKWTVRPAAVVRVPPVEVRRRTVSVGAVLPGPPRGPRIRRGGEEDLQRCIRSDDGPDVPALDDDPAAPMSSRCGATSSARTSGTRRRG